MSVGGGSGADVARLRQFYTSCPAAVADSTENWEPSAATFTDAAWEEKCSRIIGTYRKKAEKKFLIEGIIEKERGDGTLANADVEARRNALDEMKTKKRDKLASQLGVTAARTESEETAFVSEFRELMYSEIAKKYSADPREMTGTQDLAGAGTSAPAGGGPPCDGILSVDVVRCSNLLPGDSNGMSDPYVTLLLSGSEKALQTPVQKKTLDPVFNKQFEMPLEAESAANGGRLELVVTAMDKDRVGDNEFLGDVTIDLCAVLGEAEGGWAGTNRCSKTFAFGDSSGQLAREEMKDLEERRSSGTTDPYGTIELVIGFRPTAEAAAAPAATEIDGAAVHMRSEQEILDQQTKAAEAAKAAADLEASAAEKAAEAARLEEEVAEAEEDIKIASATESAVAETENRKVVAAEEEATAAAVLEAQAAALEAEARAEEARLASVAASVTEEPTAAETATTVAQIQAQALAAAEAAAQQQKAEALASAEAAKAEEEAAAAARGARALEKIETPVKDQEMHVVGTRQEEHPRAVKIGIDQVSNSSLEQPETRTTNPRGGGGVIGVGSSPRRDVDAELAAGKALTTAVFEQQARQWINAVRESQSQDVVSADAELADVLRSGLILCELLNAIRPEAAVKTSKSSFPAHQRENIGKFVEGCTALGVPDAENFETADLYEGTNLMQVWRCVASLGKHTPESYTGPAMASAADIRAEIDKAADDVKAQKAAQEAEAAEEAQRAAKARAEEDRVVAQARAAEAAAAAVAAAEAEAEEAAAAAAAAAAAEQEEEVAAAEVTTLQPQQTKPVEDKRGARSPDQAETEQVEMVADENTRLLNTGDASTISEGVPPPQPQRKRWWCCVGAAAQPAAYAPPVDTEHS